MANPLITFSIVSHGQSILISNLLSDLSKLKKIYFEVIITVNIPEDLSLYEGYSFPIFIINNFSPKGFGDNNNTAFSYSNTPWFIIINPDIRIQTINIFSLLTVFQNQNIAAVAPLILSSDGQIQDSFRRFPTLYILVKRFFLGLRGLDYKVMTNPFPVDWIAGMFIIFRSSYYAKVGGFDQNRFYMYFEDADICYRFYKLGFKVFVDPSEHVFHDAQRSSRRNLKYFRWHLISAFRFLTGK
ncbi:hypothetical protein CBI30_03875 [Polynucleobacter aenigmaticus]|uniref:Glycosyltransferase 2-like domain-containing protein n=1 Tax=Polynucleobacter aenigmaticus TaxID=1743164 RepID=A0A254Q574_9BURK|nr:glycosyltransferase [Polynucleobacter aenigmaticus]OWS71981.1 hypothetical protein CBI30_03875 [Polynucleobacter aenigmaticus]